MNYRIIETYHLYPDVLLFRDIDPETGFEQVKILAIGRNESQDMEDYHCEEIVTFQDVAEAARDFIKNFTSEQADSFCKRNTMSYVE